MGDGNNSNKKRKFLNKESSNIVIVGAGLAGLGVAVALENAGCTNVSLYERDESFERQKEGYGLTLTYNPKGPLAALGILEDVALVDCPSRSHYIFRPDGSILGYFGNAFSEHRGLGQRGNLRVPRKALRKMLIEKLQHTKIFWGYHLTDYQFDSRTTRYTLHFDLSSSLVSDSRRPQIEVADLLVAADGIRSAVLSKIYQQFPTNSLKENVEGNEPPVGEMTRNNTQNGTSSPHSIGLRYTDVRLILGIADFTHPLLYERGFYTLDGKHRLFTMPYSCNRFDTSKTNRIMWQLSFSESDRSTPLDPISLRDYVLQTCQSWHDPVLSMIRATPTEKIWGTDLMDRDPKQVQEMIQSNNIKRLVVVGDALHTMTPFKGQGANQALADGPLLANCLKRGSVDAAVKAFWRETVHRTAPVVQASRKAAQELHSPEILVQDHGFAGIQDTTIGSFLETLRAQNIGAGLAGTLDSNVQKVIEEEHIDTSDPPFAVVPEEQRMALEHAKSGNTPLLRLQSLQKHAESIRTAKDEQGRGCLHWSVIGDHYGTCHWLLTEADCNPAVVDTSGKTPYDYATKPSIRRIFEAIQTE